MSEKTRRLDLGVFEHGDTEWDHTDAVEAIDELAIERGGIEDRPETGAYDDELYLATDQRILWRWDADEDDWRMVGGLGSDRSPLDAVNAETVSTDELQGSSGRSIELTEDLHLPVDHDGYGHDSSQISWQTPRSWRYNSGEFHSLLETSYRDGGGYGVSGHWQIMSAHHYGPAFGMMNAPDVQCPIHVFGSEPDSGAAEFSITWGDHHDRRNRMWLSKAGGSMLEESSPAAELSILTNYRRQSQVTHLALTPNYLREERGDGSTEITEADTPITPGSFRFRGAYWDDGLQTARMLQFEPSMDANAHEFHVKVQVETEDGDMVETARVDHEGVWSVRDLDVNDRFRPPAVDAVDDLPGDEDAREPDLAWVRDEQRWYTYTDAEGWIRGGPVGDANQAD